MGRSRRGPFGWSGVGCAAVLMLLGTASGLSAQETAAPGAVPRTVTAKKDANLIRINGTPTVLLWASGLEDPEEVEAYAALGLNTVAVTVHDVSDEALTKASDLATAAEEQGLLVVGVLAPDALVDDAGRVLSPDPEQPAYAEAVQAFVRRAVSQLSAHPRLVAWVVAGVAPDQVVAGDVSFQAFLSRSYASVDDLNASWGTTFGDFTDVRASSVGDIDSTRPLGMGRARVDYAYFRQQTYAGAVGIWDNAVRQADAKRLLLVGNVTDYRSSISLESGFDGIVAATTPSVGEADTVTSNVQAVDIARRGNQFIAVQTLDATHSAAPQSLGAWIDLALMHGASGIQIWSWTALRDSAPLAGIVKARADMLATTTAFPAKPVARSAILYEPYAGGEMRFGKSLYGYLEGLTEGEPTGLFFSVKNGSCYGLIDVLSLETLPKADLRQYGVLFAPMAFYLPEPVQIRLNQFALEGGALVADAGIGMYQAQGRVDSVPPVIRDTFGLREAELAKIGGGQATGSPYQPGTPITGPTIGTPAPGRRADRPVTREEEIAEILSELPELQEESSLLAHFGASLSGPGGTAFHVRDVGRGFAVFAPTFLYQNWGRGADDFVTFHDRLFSLARDLQVVDPEGLWPPLAVSSASNQSVVAVAPEGTPAAVDVYFARDQLYRIPGGAQRVRNSQEGGVPQLIFPGTAISVAQPVPIRVTPSAEGADLVVSVAQYDAAKVVLTIYGAESTVDVPKGVLTVRGGRYTPGEIVLRTGDFRIVAGVTYHVVVAENGKVQADYATMPNRETGVIAISGTFRYSRITVEPAEDVPGESDTTPEP